MSTIQSDWSQIIIWPSLVWKGVHTMWKVWVTIYTKFGILRQYGVHSLLRILFLFMTMYLDNYWTSLFSDAANTTTKNTSPLFFFSLLQPLLRCWLVCWHSCVRRQCNQLTNQCPIRRTKIHKYQLVVVWHHSKTMSFFLLFHAPLPLYIPYVDRPH